MDAIRRRTPEQIAGLAGKMKDFLGSDVEAAIMKFQNFEHLEARGRKDEGRSDDDDRT